MFLLSLFCSYFGAVILVLYYSILSAGIIPLLFQLVAKLSNEGRTWEYSFESMIPKYKISVYLCNYLSFVYSFSYSMQQQTFRNKHLESFKKPTHLFKIILQMAAVTQ